MRENEMLTCRFCGWFNRHNPNCPVVTKNRAVWEAGYEAGRKGHVFDHRNPTWVIGFLQGNIALEEAQNGFDPISEGRQW